MTEMCIRDSLHVTALAEATPAEANLIVSIPAPVVGFIPATKDSITISYRGIDHLIFSVKWSSYVIVKDAEHHDKVVSTLLQNNEKFEAGKKYLEMCIRDRDYVLLIITPAGDTAAVRQEVTGFFTCLLYTSRCV